MFTEIAIEYKLLKFNLETVEFRIYWYDISTLLANIDKNKNVLPINAEKQEEEVMIL